MSDYINQKWRTRRETATLSKVIKDTTICLLLNPAWNTLLQLLRRSCLTRGSKCQGKSGSGWTLATNPLTFRSSYCSTNRSQMNKNNEQSWTTVWLAADNQKAAKRVWHKNKPINTKFYIKICEKQIYNPKKNLVENFTLRLPGLCNFHESDNKSSWLPVTVTVYIVSPMAKCLMNMITFNWFPV